VKETCEQVVPRDKSFPANLDGPVGGYVYDAAAGTTLAIWVDYQVYGAEQAMKKRGFPTEEAHVWALDIDKKEWVMQPRPAGGVLPPLNGMGSIHHYYDPVHNATVVYRGHYNQPGETWVYRCRKRD